MHKTPRNKLSLEDFLFLFDAFGYISVGKEPFDCKSGIKKA